MFLGHNFGKLGGRKSDAQRDIEKKIKNKENYLFYQKFSNFVH